MLTFFMESYLSKISNIDQSRAVRRRSFISVCCFTSDRALRTKSHSVMYLSPIAPGSGSPGRSGGGGASGPSGVGGSGGSIGGAGGGGGRWGEKGGVSG